MRTKAFIIYLKNYKINTSTVANVLKAAVIETTFLIERKMKMWNIKSIPFY